ncbi:MAG: DUF2254 family protein [Hyphomicrobium sp.]|nr:DUF2254 family protein [Hyphomicrobium sp.]
MPPAFGAERRRRGVSGRLWFGLLSAAVLTGFVIGAAVVTGPLLDDYHSVEIEKSSLLTLYAAFAAGLLPLAALTVTAIITAAGVVSQSTTPRASRIVMRDGKGIGVLRLTTGSFVFAVGCAAAIELLPMARSGHLILFIGLVLAMAAVLLAFVRWIGEAARLGHSIAGIETLARAAREALKVDNIGTYGAVPWSGDIPSGAAAVRPTSMGWVDYVDVRRLGAWAEKQDCRIVVTVRPGDLAEPSVPIAYVAPGEALTTKLEKRIVTAIRLESVPRDGVDVRTRIRALSETADRALSPGVNDPGTAIAVLSELMSVLVRYVEIRRAASLADVRTLRVELPPLSPTDLLEDAFTAIARDGSGAIEVVVALQKSLATLARMGDPEVADAAMRMSDVSLQLADAALPIAAHRDRAFAAAEVVRTAAGAGTTGLSS